MIDDGIFDGDYVFVKKTMIAEQGEIVIAMIENEATCKRFFIEEDHIRLQPANQSMSPIIVRRQDFRQTMILGKVVGVFRKCSKWVKSPFHHTESPSEIFFFSFDRRLTPQTGCLVSRPSWS